MLGMFLLSGRFVTQVVDPGPYIAGLHHVAPQVPKTLAFLPCSRLPTRGSTIQTQAVRKPNFQVT